MKERDILVFTDNDGQEINMEILDYFEYDEEEYAMLVEVEEHEHDDECDHEHEEDEEKNIYIMKVIVDGDTEEFVPVEEEKMDELIEAIQELYDEDMEYDDEDLEDVDKE